MAQRKTGAEGCQATAGKTVRWIVPYSSGGGYDVYSRLLEPFYERRLGAEILVQNMPGAGGLLGSIALRDAPPDGLTIGILNGAGLMATALTGETEAPNPAQEYTILGRIVRNRHVLLTRGDGPLTSLIRLVQEAESRTILPASTGPGSLSFVSSTLALHLLNLDFQHVTGYAGSRQCALAVIRGEVDILASSFSSAIDHVEAGALRPILQIGTARLDPHPSLDGVPLLGGDDGAAAQRAAEEGRSKRDAVEHAAALVGLIGAGRLIAAPRGLAPRLQACMEDKLHAAMRDERFRTALVRANRELDVARGRAARADVQAAAAHADRFIPVLKDAIQNLRT